MIVINNVVIDHSKRIRGFLIKNEVFKDWETRIDIMTYQFGEACKFFKVYNKAYSSQPNIAKGYETEGKLALANFVVQLEIFCATKGINFDELRDLGYEHLKIKMQEVHDKGGKII